MWFYHRDTPRKNTEIHKGFILGLRLISQRRRKVPEERFILRAGLQSSLKYALKQKEKRSIYQSLQASTPPSLINEIVSYENNCPSPDSSGNPFAFFFKKQKIGTDSGIGC